MFARCQTRQTARVSTTKPQNNKASRPLEAADEYPDTQMASKAVLFTPVMLYEGPLQKCVFQGGLHSCEHHCLQKFLGLCQPFLIAVVFLASNCKAPVEIVPEPVFAPCLFRGVKLKHFNVKVLLQNRKFNHAFQPEKIRRRKVCRNKSNISYQPDTARLEPARGEGKGGGEAQQLGMIHHASCTTTGPQNQSDIKSRRLRPVCPRFIAK